MEPSKKRKTSHMWEYYEMTDHNKVKCLLCDRVLVYNNNTSSMIRHYRAMHENKHTSDTGDTSQSSRKQVLDEAVANLIVKDSQPFSVVEDEGFRELIHLLDPTYVLPTRKDYEIIEESLPVLFPFFQATSELSEEKRVSISKVIPLMNMLHHAVLTKMANIKNDVARLLSENLLRRVKEQVSNIESLSVMTMATLLDPRFKTLGFLSQSKAQEAVRRLKAECSTLIASNEGVQLQESGDAGEGASRSCELWSLLDTTVDQKRHSSNATADAIVEVERYLAEKNLRRHEDPLVYWHTQKHVHPHLYCMALKFLCSPASSVPCERVFSKAGEVICRRRNRNLELFPDTVLDFLSEPLWTFDLLALTPEHVPDMCFGFAL
ncbi:zinc finger BED domain-containing protein 4-like [Cyprinodon tularosa]|uniref:zinc finger BED domain-containing protein 4-like n=1 Tax=Cyprinodon tularosa TaxID=77115 RepID=UPI0018E2761E|nr:zinc finger BED domain-containing protein 4-like [Cyprinodon tularosa]